MNHLTADAYEAACRRDAEGQAGKDTSQVHLAESALADQPRSRTSGLPSISSGTGLARRPPFGRSCWAASLADNSAPTEAAKSPRRVKFHVFSAFVRADSCSGDPGVGGFAAVVAALAQEVLLSKHGC